MKHRSLHLAGLALLLGASVPAFAQNAPISGGSGAAADGRGVSASTYGTGTTDANSVGVTGGGSATADGGTAETRSKARMNDRRAMQRSMATARTDDERARSRTMTTVRKGDEVRSRSMSIYKQRGERPVIERDCTIATADGTRSCSKR
jgi:hypothetical protein